MKTGTIDVLNTGCGHLEIAFNKEDAIEMARAKRAIQDMLKRGYVLFIHGTDNALIRVEEFDATHGKYIVSDVPNLPRIAPNMEPIEATETLPKECAECATEIVNPPAAESIKGKRGRPRKAIPMEKAKVTAIGRSAGG